MENFDLIVAQNISDQLEKNNKKQADLARYLNLPRQTISKILAGKRNLLANEITSIARFFSCEISELTKEKGKIDDNNIYAYFMGEVSNKKIKEVFNDIFTLSDIIIEQQYLNDNKE